jgi:hypothetical protein
VKGIRESDWKLLRDLKPTLLDRYCARVLDEAARVARGRQGSAHERYLELFEHVRRSDKKLARAFDDLRRSNALLKLAIMHAYGLLTPDEFRQFSDETRETIERITRDA